MTKKGKNKSDREKIKKRGRRGERKNLRRLGYFRIGKEEFSKQRKIEEQSLFLSLKILSVILQ